MSTIDIAEIIELLPYRYPFLLIDRVVDCTPGERLTAIKNISYNEPFFQGHFPNNPMMPGTLIIEAMAQACIILAYLSVPEEEEKPLHFFAGIDNVRFLQPVRPGDQLQFEVEFLGNRRSMWKTSCQASVAGVLVSSGELMSMALSQEDAARSS